MIKYTNMFLKFCEEHQQQQNDYEKKKKYINFVS